LDFVISKGDVVSSVTPVKEYNANSKEIVIQLKVLHAHLKEWLVDPAISEIN
jgi:hypothetical protein